MQKRQKRQHQGDSGKIEVNSTIVQEVNVDAALLLRRAKGASRYRNVTGVKAWCKANGVSNSHACEFLRGQRLPTSDLLEALGLEWRIMRKRGCDDSHQAETDIEEHGCKFLVISGDVNNGKAN